MADTKYRLRVEHTCDSGHLRAAAIRRMTELKHKADKLVKVEHLFHDQAQVDSVKIEWMNQQILVVVSFRGHEALVGITVPKGLSMFRSLLETRVRREIELLVADCGGKLHSVSEIPAG